MNLKRIKDTKVVKTEELKESERLAKAVKSLIARELPEIYKHVTVRANTPTTVELAVSAKGPYEPENENQVEKEADQNYQKVESLLSKKYKLYKPRWEGYANTTIVEKR